MYDPADPHSTYGGDNLFITPCGPQDQTLPEATNESVTAYHALLNGLNGSKVTYHNGSSPCYNNSCVGGCLTQMQRLYKACIDSPRPDIIRFTTKPFELPMTILGNVTASLEVSSNASDTDFVAKLIDVWPNGTAMLVEQGALRMRWRNGPFATKPAPHMRPNERYTIEVNLGMTSYVINKGHSLRLTITSSFWPYYSANPNTGELLMKPPEKNHTIWPVWPDHIKNITARNVVHHGRKAVLTIPVHEL